jgi:hypothetical protein
VGQSNHKREFIPALIDPALRDPKDFGRFVDLDETIVWFFLRFPSHETKPPVKDRDLEAMNSPARSGAPGTIEPDLGWFGHNT